MSTVADIQVRGWARARRLSGLGGRGAVVTAAVFLVVVLAAALLASVVAPDNPSAVDLGNILAPPGSAGHLLGTDATGRDTLSRLLFGARISLFAPLAIDVISTILGTLIGLLAGWFGGFIDAALARAMDFLFAFPGLLLGMIAVALFGTGLKAPLVGLIIAYTPYTARLTRGMVSQERTRPYVESYRLQGFSGFQIASRMVLPNVAPILLAQSALGFGYALIDLAGLSYLGFGVQPPTADWGVMVSDAQQGILQGDVWLAVIPCAAIVLTVVAFNVVGDYIGERIGRTGSA